MLWPSRVQPKTFREAGTGFISLDALPVPLETKLYCCLYFLLHNTMTSQLNKIKTNYCCRAGHI